jgi:hypothetical protein
VIRRPATRKKDRPRSNLPDTPPLRCFLQRIDPAAINLAIVPVATYLVRRTLCYRMWRPHHSPSDSQRNPFLPFTSPRICS